MQPYSFYILVFLSASIITYLNVYNSDKFHNYFFLIYNQGWLILYCIFYGLAGIGLYLVVKDNVFIVEENNTKIATPYLIAIGVGIATKGVADINLFNIKYSGQITPIGFKTISRQVDLFFESQIEPICFERMTEFMIPFSNKYKNTNLEKFKLNIIEALKSWPTLEKLPAFTEELAKAASTKEVLESILREYGQKALKTLNNNIPATL